jgi:signal transduction histidine kinase/DNA-binding response OmpR family regulator
MPSERAWHKEAVRAKDSTIMVKLHPDMITKELIVTYARQISDKKGRPLAVLAIDINMEHIKQLVINMHFAKNGYGLLLDENLEIFVHPNEKMIGKTMYDVSEHVASLAKAIGVNGNVVEYELKNYNGNNYIVFLWELENNWYLGLITPKSKYYKSIMDMLLLLATLGFIMATILSIVLIRYSIAQTRSEEYVKIYEANERMRIEMHKAETAEASNKAKSKFLAAMSHEIRTPMNAILGLAEINMQNQYLPQETREEFEKIYNSGDLLLRLINDILDLSKIEAGKLEIRTGQYSVASLIHDAVQLNITRIGSKQLEFKLQLDENIPSELIGDELRIKQILNNLLSNAFKYTDDGSITLSIVAEPREGDKCITLVFEVCDTGQGMTEEQLKGLFNEYARFNLEANRLIQGAGLGLNITKQLIDMMKGEISVESKPGKGSVFTMRLPQKIANHSVLGRDLTEKLLNYKFSDVSKIKKPRIIREQMPYGRVLVVDDVEMNLYIAKVLLKPYDLQIETADSGFEAIEKIKSGNIYSIIFMDHMMPKMDGIEATRQIREMGYEHPIVALTANAVAGQAEIFLASGFDDFISKPIDIRQLNSVLNKLIRDRRSDETIGEIMLGIDSVLLAVFAHDARKALDIINPVLKNIDDASDEDLRLFTVQVHAMKSNLANIGENELSEQAYLLEKAGKAKDKKLIKKEAGSFSAKLLAITQKIEANAKIQGAKQDEDPEYLKEQLKIIAEASAAYDIRAIDIALANLNKMHWTRETRELIDKISGYILHSDFEEANTLAASHLKTP